MNFLYLALIILFFFGNKDITKFPKKTYTPNRTSDMNKVFVLKHNIMILNPSYSEINDAKIRLIIANIEPNPGPQPQTYQKCEKCNTKYDALKMNHCESCCGFYRIGFTHCCKCKKNYKQNSETTHCAKCCKDYDNKNYHCCCGYSATNEFVSKNPNLIHCCKCNSVNDNSIKKHCVLCCFEQPIDSTLNHCCNCIEKYDSNVNSHCYKCHITYDNSYSHCCKCNKNWKTDTHSHCCNCNVVYDNALIHKCCCNSTLDNTKKHCDSCCFVQKKSDTRKHCCSHVTKPLWDENTQIHCCPCDIVYDINFGEIHKCCCKTNIDMTQKHCDNCCLVQNITDTNPHCCHCKKTYDLNLKHCCKCKKEYNADSFSHCCKCKKEYDDKLLAHCSCCCTLFPHNFEHCCSCNSMWEKECGQKCNCSEIKRIMSIHVINYVDSLKMPNKFLFSSCLAQCESALLFINGIKILGFESLKEFFSDEENFMFCLHGTPSVSSACNISCQSWNLSFRGRIGQVYGKGEYFSTNIETAKYYAGIDGAIMVSVIPKNKNNIRTYDSIVKTHRHSYCENWYIVENTPSAFFALPVGVLQCNKELPELLTCQKLIKEKIIAEITDKAKKESFCIFFKGDTGKTQYDSQTIKTIISNIQSGIFVFDIMINSNLYTIDLQNMKQVNKTTKFKRDIYI